MINRIESLSADQKKQLIKRFIRIDFGVPHVHQPCEMAHIVRAMFERPAGSDEVMVEAGCWKGGSTAKFSIMCKMSGCRLFVYDSFQGVEETDQEGFDYSGEYAAGLEEVRSYVEEFGEIDVCQFFPGWFADTLAGRELPPVRAVYIDCDLVKGTYEVLQSVLPSLADDGLVFSQDYHIPVVKKHLHDPDWWKGLGRGLPEIEYLCHNLARIDIPPS